jgi:hypothetical protein
MGKIMLLATVIVLAVGIIWGLTGLLWIYVFSVPVGIVLWIFAKIVKWL